MDKRICFIIQRRRRWRVHSGVLPRTLSNTLREEFPASSLLRQIEQGKSSGSGLSPCGLQTDLPHLVVIISHQKSDLNRVGFCQSYLL